MGAASLQGPSERREKPDGVPRVPLRCPGRRRSSCPHCGLFSVPRRGMDVSGCTAREAGEACHTIHFVLKVALRGHCCYTPIAQARTTEAGTVTVAPWAIQVCTQHTAEAGTQVREAQSLLACHSHRVSTGTKMTCASTPDCSPPESTGSPTTTGC